MDIFKKLKNNKGTISSALGKELAQKALGGKEEILHEAIRLASYEPGNIEAKNIRTGAAKIVEFVAKKKPIFVATHLDKLLKALDMPEPQTRWIIIRAFGFCAHLNPKRAVKAIDYARNFLDSDEGVCLTGAASLYLGDLGSVSPAYAKLALPILNEFIKKASVNEVDWVLEAYIKIYDNIIQADQQKIKTFASKHKKAPKQSTRKRVEKILKK